MRFRPEPPFEHGQAPRTAIVLCNLGTPDAPTASALRRYLAQFLWDPRVVEIPRPLWWLILHGIVLRVRPAKSAAKYASVWTPEGSPLAHWTARQALLLRGWMGERGHRVTVRHAMRYGQPAIGQVLDELKAEGATRILILPAYPQYSGTTTASVSDAVFDWARTVRHLPELRFINRYGDHAGYIRALAARVRAHWQAQGRPDRLLMSFHGVPERTWTLGDPYPCECRQTARLLAQELALADGQWSLSFQSRFGRAKWIGPDTVATLRTLARQGNERVDVICPGFTSDCLETLEEIAQEARHAFLEAGGKAFHYIPCLNDQDAWIGALADLAEQHLGGWPTRETPDPARLARSRVAALAEGAPR